MREFFEAIYGENTGQASITRNDVHGNPVMDRYFTYPDQLDAMVEYCERYAHENVYFTPTLMRSTSRTKSAASKLHVAFADADLFDITTFKAEPSIIVRTSEEKHHVYWVLEDEDNPFEIEKINHAISVAHPKDETGLDTGWAANKLLRVPGTSNLKYDTRFEVTWEHMGVVYYTHELESHYPKVETGQVQFREREDLPTRAEAMNSVEWSSTISDILEERFRRGNRSEALHFATHELFRAGATDEVAFVLLKDSNLNKWAQDGMANADDKLWDDIQRSRSKSNVVVAADASPLATKAAMTEDVVVNFLTKEEQDNLPTTFVDEFVAWSASKTHTNKEFQIAAGFNILSTIFSDFGHVPMQFGSLPLNLWFIVGGRSTFDRKTTVLNQMLHVLDMLSDGEDYSYELGSDFTMSGLSERLLKLPNRSGVVHVDEFQGFLAELSKNYMAGTKDSLTELYSGKVKGKLRSTGDTKVQKSVKFSLNFYAMGIAKHIIESLSKDDFLSGFLTRFAWVVPQTEDEQFDPNLGFELEPLEIQKGGDHVLMDMIDRLRGARDTFEGFTSALDDLTRPIRPTPETFERMKQYRIQVFDAAKRLNREEISSSAERLTQHTLKCAALLAMSEGKQVVEVQHMVSAINFSNSWFQNLIYAAEQVSDTGWVKDQEEICTALLEEGSTMSAKGLYAKFSGKHKPRDYNELLKSLVDSGQIEVVPEGKKTVVNYVGGYDA